MPASKKADARFDNEKQKRDSEKLKVDARLDNEQQKSAALTNRVDNEQQKSAALTNRVDNEQQKSAALTNCVDNFVSAMSPAMLFAKFETAVYEFVATKIPVGWEGKEEEIKYSV